MKRTKPAAALVEALAWAPSRHTGAETSLTAVHEFEIGPGMVEELDLTMNVTSEDVHLKLTQSVITVGRDTSVSEVLNHAMSRAEATEFFALLAYAASRLTAHDTARAVAEGGTTR